MALYQLGYINLLFADEVSFSLVPSIPYGWIQKGKSAIIPVRKARVMKLFGAISLDNLFYGFPTKDKIDASFIIEVLEKIAQKSKLPTVVVLDNAAYHHKAVKLKKEEWEKQNLFVFFLPPYSPHLNRIEILWRFIKHSWLRPENYIDAESLWDAVIDILKKFGSELTINFSYQF